MHRLLPPRSALALTALTLLSACGSGEVDVTLFEDITAHTPLAGYQGMTHGAAWGDYDGDGRPDLYLTNHLNPAMLLHNLGGGRFRDVTAAVLGEQTGGDKHGAAWADFDHDGDLDLVQLTGAIQGLGQEPKRLFVNQGGVLTDQAQALGVDNLPGRTRTPLWVDLDGDGRLDLFQGAEARFDALTPPFFFAHQGAAFAAMPAWLPLASRSAPFCVLTALNHDRHPEIVCRLGGRDTASQVFDTASRPARSIDVLPQIGFDDAAVGDFDNDGALDLFLARKNPGGPVSLASGGPGVLTAQAQLLPRHADKTLGFRFKAQGPVRFSLAGQHGGDLQAGDIRIGGQAAPASALELTLTPEAAAGMPDSAPQPGRPALHIGSPEAGVWEVRFLIQAAAFGGKNKPRNLALRVHAAEISAVRAVADSTGDETAPQRLFMNRNGALVDEGEDRGVHARPIAATNVVAADFDNDMHLDLFLLGSNDAGKTENLLLLNDGKGRFTPVRAAGGAAGKLAGVGDSVTTADVDGDGCLDLLTASGASMGRSLGLPSNDGRYQLFRNLCKTGNHWLMIDLEGTKSNRDGIGARVVLEAGGVRQTRLQGGGMHERGQDHKRLHFGLGPHARADRITVYWPSGTVQVIAGAPAGQVLRVKETHTSDITPP